MSCGFAVAGYTQPAQFPGAKYVHRRLVGFQLWTGWCPRWIGGHRACRARWPNV